MRAAAHHMVRNLTAGLALITTREPLLISLSNNLKNTFMSTLRNPTQQQKDMVEQAAQVIITTGFSLTLYLTMEQNVG